MRVIMYLHINKSVKSQTLPEIILLQPLLLWFQLSQNIEIDFDEDVENKAIFSRLAIVHTIFSLILTTKEERDCTPSKCVFFRYLPVNQATPFNTGLRKTQINGLTCLGELVWNERFINWLWCSVRNNIKSRIRITINENCDFRGRFA